MVVRCTGAYLDSSLGQWSLRLELAPSAPWVPTPRGLSQNAQVWDTNKSAMHGVQSAIWYMIRGNLSILAHILDFANIPLGPLLIYQII
jgi:hypothetical protein